MLRRMVCAAPTQTIPLPIITDVVEILVFGREGGPTLAGAIELASPANKDRPEHRDAFVTKSAAYLQQGLGLVVVDVVSGRRANLHHELLGRLGSASSLPPDAGLYAASYRPIERDGRPSLDIWHEPLAHRQSDAQPTALAPGRSACKSISTARMTAPAASSGSWSIYRAMNDARDRRWVLSPMADPSRSAVAPPGPDRHRPIAGRAGSYSGPVGGPL